MDVLYFGSFWLIRGRLFWEGEDAYLHPSVYRILIIYGITVSEQYVVKLSSLPYFWWYFTQPCCFSIFNFLSIESSSSRVNSPCLMSNTLLIILVICSCVTFGDFPSNFSKCCFHRCIRSCWLEAFSLALELLFLRLTSFIVCHAILDCLSSTESLQINSFISFERKSKFYFFKDPFSF